MIIKSKKLMCKNKYFNSLQIALNGKIIHLLVCAILLQSAGLVLNNIYSECVLKFILFRL